MPGLQGEPFAVTPSYSRWLARVVNTYRVSRSPNLKARFVRAAFEDHLPSWLREEGEAALRDDRELRRGAIARDRGSL